MTTRTQPKTLSASRRKRRPELECLEEKKVLSTLFGDYPAASGTWAYNDQAGWREINSANSSKAGVSEAEGRGATDWRLAVERGSIARTSRASPLGGGISTVKAVKKLKFGGTCGCHGLRPARTP
jgi:hypothetical protein